MGPHLVKALHGMLAASLALTLLAGEAQAQELSAPQKGAPAPVLILDGTFVVSQLDGAKLSRVKYERRPSFTFLDDNRFAGFSGCRAFEGQLVRDSAERIQISVTKVTGAGCKGQLAQIENRFFASLKASRRLELSDELQLLDSRNRILLSFDSITERFLMVPRIDGRTWALTHFEGVTLRKDNPKPTLVLRGTTVTGSTGCNQFSGNVISQARKVAFVIKTQTQRACLAPEGDPMALEADYLQALAHVDKIYLTPSTLTLSATNSETLLVFSLEP
jgi:heat shock protein HslJ